MHPVLICVFNLNKKQTIEEVQQTKILFLIGCYFVSLPDKILIYHTIN